ncbi:MAG: helix-turn-helix transcriptional regulator [Clostridia bacterium]|nr:helix-turn-helix transcriptional regulator [Clostridia bacterium]
MTKPKKIFDGKSLKRFRAEKKLSQADVADTLGILPQAYYRYECNKATPSADVIMKIADAFGVTTDYLLGRSDTPQPANFDEREVKAAFAIRDDYLQLRSILEKKVPAMAPMQ